MGFNNIENNSFYVYKPVRLDHVIDNVTLRNLERKSFLIPDRNLYLRTYFFRSELARSRQILAVIISQMIVAHNRYRFDASTHQEVDQYGFDFGLSRFEIISSNEDVMVFGQL